MKYALDCDGLVTAAGEELLSRGPLFRCLACNGLALHKRNEGGSARFAHAVSPASSGCALDADAMVTAVRAVQAHRVLAVGGHVWQADSLRLDAGFARLTDGQKTLGRDPSCDVRLTRKLLNQLRKQLLMPPSLAVAD